jgi:predicted Zn-dependent protease
MDTSAKKLIVEKKYTEAIGNVNQLLKHCTDSIKLIGAKCECLLGLNKVTAAIEYTTAIQANYIENPEYLYWRGRILTYNGNTDMGKKFIQKALS